MSTQNETIDLGEILNVLRREVRWIAAGLLLGLLAATAVLLLARPQYRATATVLLRTSGDGGSSLLAGGRSGSGGGLSLGGLNDLFLLGSGFDTELEILASRAVIGAVVDSLGLQARVQRPHGVAPRELFERVDVEPAPVRASYRFEWRADGYAVSGPGAPGRVRPGEPLRLPGATLVLRANPPADAFTVRLLDREEAIERVEKLLRARKAGGDVAELTFRAPDRLTAAALPNALIAKYLERRVTTDRGVNQHRYEFLLTHTDSIRQQLTSAEQSLRRQQEASGVIDPEMQGQAELEQGLALRAQLETTEVEARALQGIVAGTAAGTLDARALAAYPTFLGNPAINQLLSRLVDVETRRTELLDRRTEADPDVQVMDQSIAGLEGQLLTLSRAYLDGLNRRQAQLRSELGRYSSALAALPAQAEESHRLQREVVRLSETLVALETQLVQARLAAIAEGGDVRQIDVAVPPRRPDFPRPALTLGLGLFGGLLLGLVGGLGHGYLGTRVRTPRDAELATGVPALALDPAAPILIGGIGGIGEWRSLLVIPVGREGGALEVAHRVAATAALRGERVVLADLEAPAPARALPPPAEGGEVGTQLAGAPELEEVPRGEAARRAGYPVFRARTNGHPGADARRAVERLEEHFELVIAALPDLAQPTTAALLDPRRPVVLAAGAGKTSRAELREAATAIERLGASVTGVVLR